MKIERSEPRRQSGIESFLRCGEYFRRSRVMGERRQTTKMLVGSCLSRVAEMDTHEKLHGARCLTIKESIDIGLEAFEELQDKEAISDPQNLPKAGNSVVETSRVHAVKVSPEVKDPICAEERWGALISPEDGGEKIHFQGTPDLVTEKGIGDYKTGKRWNPEVARKHRQISFYAALHLANLGRLPETGWIDNIFRVRENFWGYQRLPVPINRPSIEAALEVLRIVVRAQENEIYLPAANTDWFCAEGFCPFFKDCRFVGGQEE